MKHLDRVPRYFVQTEDGQLHAYFTLQVLLCDLAFHSGEGVKLYRVAERGFTVRYLPTTAEEIREMATGGHDAA